MRAATIKTALEPFKIALIVGNDDRFDIVFVVTLPPSPALYGNPTTYVQVTCEKAQVIWNWSN